jgi:hypothetical protein
VCETCTDPPDPSPVEIARLVGAVIGGLWASGDVNLDNANDEGAGAVKKPDPGCVKDGKKEKKPLGTVNVPRNWPVRGGWFGGGGGGGFLGDFNLGTVINPTIGELNMYGFLTGLGGGGGSGGVGGGSGIGAAAGKSFGGAAGKPSSGVCSKPTSPNYTPPKYASCTEAWVVDWHPLQGSRGMYSGRLADYTPPNAPPLETCFTYIGADSERREIYRRINAQSELYYRWNK